MEEMEYINKQLVEADIKAIKRYDVDINKTYAFIARRLYELKESEYFRNANYKGYKDIYDLALNEFGYQREKVRYLIEIYLKFFYEKFDNYYKNFSVSQLKYMAGMSEDKLEKCNPDMTVREIKSILIENTTRVGRESIENSTSENAVSQEKVINGIFPDEKEEEKTITTIVTELPKEQRKENKTIVVDLKTDDNEETLSDENVDENIYKKSYYKELKRNEELCIKSNKLSEENERLRKAFNMQNSVLNYFHAELRRIQDDDDTYEKVDILLNDMWKFISENILPEKVYFMEKVI